MPGKHKKPTISFRVSDAERSIIEANIKASGMTKQEFFAKSCMYHQITVIGRRQTIYPLVLEIREMREELKKLMEEYAVNDISISFEELRTKSEEYLALLSAIIRMLDAAAYIWKEDK